MKRNYHNLIKKKIINEPTVKKTFFGSSKIAK
jgi:hypothetical protein